MCGIAGLIHKHPHRPVAEDDLRAMSRAIARRGPDGQGFHLAPGVGLAHRRLAIIDLEGGAQPISNEDGTVHIVFNGEIYNYRELHGELEGRGHRFKTQSDTEVLIHLYEDFGARLVDRLVGMFSFAIWDDRRRRLVLGRDRLGIKPLYIHRGKDTLLFGSELKALLAYPGVPREIDVEALEDYLALGVVPGPRTIFRGIEKLPPAHTLTVGPEDWDAPAERYWSLRIEADPKPGLSEWVEAVRVMLDISVRDHLVADVPVGAFLSGGVDSSALVAWAAGKVTGRLKTFSIGFGEDGFSELPHARRVADLFGTEHVEQIVRPDAAGLLGELAEFFDEPFADPSALPTYLLSRLTAGSVKVALSGDGGDEAFGGYARYAHDLDEAAWRDRLPAWFRRKALGPVASAWPSADWLPRPLRARTRLNNLAMDADAAYANTLTICRSPLRRRLIHTDLATGLNGHEPGRVVREGFAAGQGAGALGGMIAADVAVLLPDDFLVKVDRASMAHGLEVRPPLLDHRLMELAARIPSDLKVRDGETKWIFKAACRGRLPDDLLDRPKQGFDVPVDAWLRGPLRTLFHEAVLDPRARVAGLVDQARVRRLFASHVAGRCRQGRTLWALLVLALWAECHMNADQSASRNLSCSAM